MSENTDNTDKRLRNLKPFKSGAEWTGNALGRPKGSISIMDNIRHIFESDPIRFQEFINKYLSDPKNRQHIVEMIDGKPQGIGINIDNRTLNVNYTPEDLWAGVRALYKQANLSDEEFLKKVKDD